jgi:hypothetical protein
MTRDYQAGERAGTKVLALALACFLGGAVLGAFVLYHPMHTGPRPGVSTPVSLLSTNTRAVLLSLRSPVDVRCYSLLDPASTSPALQAFAGRVDQLVSEYQREAQGKIVPHHYSSVSDSAAADAASADGIKPFNLDKGAACFLGIAVACEGRKESLPQLSPEWEPALESDLTRAILRVSPSQSSSVVSVQAPTTDKATLEDVKHLVPNFASVPMEDGLRIIREAAMKDFQATANEEAAQLKQAQQRLAEAQSSGSDADRQAAMKFLQQVQAEQTEKLRQIAARTQAQIEALKQLKAPAP